MREWIYRIKDDEVVVNWGMQRADVTEEDTGIGGE